MGISDRSSDVFSSDLMEAKSLPKKEKKEAIAIELEIENIIYDIIEEGIAAGVFRPVNARLLASVVKAMMQDWYLKRRKYRNQGTDLTSYGRFVWSLLEKYRKGVV